jgi:nucleotide-binding universal stress UspA family protein
MKILLPTDFSDNAFNAIEYTVDLFQEQQVDFVLMNAYSLGKYAIGDHISPEPGQPMYDEAEKQSIEGLRKTKQRLGNRLDNDKHSFEVVSSFGFVYDNAAKLIEERDIDLLVIGNRGATEERKRILGSNAMDLMENLHHCAMMTVPADTEFTGLDELVFTTKFDQSFKKRDLDLIAQLARHNNTKVIALHVGSPEELSEKQQQNMHSLKERLAVESYENRFMEDMELTMGIRAFVSSRDSDMVCLPHRKKGFFGKLLSKPVIEDLIKHCNIPILKIPTHR